MKHSLVGMVLAGGLLIAGAAQAFTLGSSTNGDPAVTVATVGIGTADIGSTFSIDWSKAITGATLAGEADFKVVSFSATEIVLDVSISNTTVTSFQSSILALGLGVSPNATGASYVTAGGTFEGIQTETNTNNQNFPGGFKLIDTCVFAANNCNGGNINNGLLSGASDAFRIAITGSFGSNPTAVTLSDFAIKYQTSAGSFEFAGNACIQDCGDTPPGGGKIPEPGIVALLGLAALAGTTASKKQRT